MKNSEFPSNTSVWNDKPWWCQPWSIILTGIALISGSWIIFSKLWLSGLVALPIAIWWYYFLVVYPKFYQT